MNAMKTQKTPELDMTTKTSRQDLTSQKDMTRIQDQTLTSLQATPLRREQIL